MMTIDLICLSALRDCFDLDVRMQKSKQQIKKIFKKSDLKQDMSWPTMCCEHTSWGHSLEEVFTSKNTLWTTTQPAPCHLSFIQAGTPSAQCVFGLTNPNEQMI